MATSGCGRPFEVGTAGWEIQDSWISKGPGRCGVEIRGRGREQRERQWGKEEGEEERKNATSGCGKPYGLSTAGWETRCSWAY